MLLLCFQQLGYEPLYSISQQADMVAASYIDVTSEM